MYFKRPLTELRSCRPSFSAPGPSFLRPPPSSEPGRSVVGKSARDFLFFCTFRSTATPSRFLLRQCEITNNVYWPLLLGNEKCFSLPSGSAQKSSATPLAHVQGREQGPDARRSRTHQRVCDSCAFSGDPLFPSLFQSSYHR